MKTLTEQALELKALNDKISADAKSAILMIPSDPQKASQWIPEVMREAETLFVTEREFLKQMGPWGAEQAAGARKNAWEMKVQLLMGQGAAAQKLRKFPEAKQFYAAALQEIGNQQHFARPMIQSALAEIAIEEG
jgi:hypothetical protein